MKSLLLAVLFVFPSLLLAAVPTTSLDIGDVGAAGSTSTANGVYTVGASGYDIWETQDEFRFVYGAMSGDGEITARVNSIAAADAWTKAGVMIRETLNANSRFAYTLVTGEKGVAFHQRVSPGEWAGPGGMADGVTRAPYWVRVRRVGNVFTGYVSADGQNWRQQGESVTIAMGANVYAGLALTSGVDGSLATAAFSNARIEAIGTTPTNTPPSISGAPATTATIGAQYAFTPTVTDPDGNTLTYSIANRPSWATFNTSTGRLAGTPTSANVGSFGNIVISVSDGQASAQLPAFTIVVSNVANNAPVISGTPPTSVTQGTSYYFRPTASDADGDPLTFSITNRPSWATFSTTSGRLRGTPTASNVGTFSNIVISVSDGKVTAQLPAFAIVVSNDDDDDDDATANGAPVISGTPATSVMQGTAYSFQPTASRSGRRPVDVLDHEPPLVGDVQHDDGPTAGHTDGKQRRSVQQHRDQCERREDHDVAGGLQRHRAGGRERLGDVELDATDHQHEWIAAHEPRGLPRALGYCRRELHQLCNTQQPRADVLRRGEPRAGYVLLRCFGAQLLGRRKRDVELRQQDDSIRRERGRPV